MTTSDGYSIKANDVVSFGVLEQIMWERDLAESQLAEIGKGLGEKMDDVVKVRHGRWIKDKNLYKCTACNDLLTVAGWADCIPEKQIYTAFKYCPNCGAKMGNEDE